MKKFLFFILIALMVPYPVHAERERLSDGSYVDEYGGIHDSKFENRDMFAPWNNPLYRDDPLAPWNSYLYRDDMMAPWNNSYADQRDTNRYLRETGERNADYYWK